MKTIVTIALVAVSGCAADTMVRYKGPSLAYTHGTAVDPMGYPMQYERAYCAQAGLAAQYVRTFTPYIPPRPATAATQTPDDPDAGQLVSQAGENLQEAGDALAAMPTSHFKCVPR